LLVAVNSWHKATKGAGKIDVLCCIFLSLVDIQ